MMHALQRWAHGTAELLDDPRSDDATVVASLRDIVRINRVFGGAAAAVRRIDEFLAAPTARELTLLDVGTGLGDIPRAATRRAAERGITLKTFGLERHPAAARAAKAEGGVRALVAEGGRLPLPPRSVDLVLCAKLLHHLPGETGRAVLREMDRVARIAVVVVDIRRSALAAAGFWLASFPMRFTPATRRDGVISVFRGFTQEELRLRCREAGVEATVRRHPGWALTAAWRPVPQA